MIFIGYGHVNLCTYWCMSPRVLVDILAEASIISIRSPIIIHLIHLCTAHALATSIYIIPPTLTSLLQE